MPEKDDISELVADIREQLLYLQELGVTEIDAALPVAAKAIASGEVVSRDEHPAAAPRIEMKAAQPAAQNTRPAGSLLAELPSLSKLSRPRPQAAMPLVPSPVAATDLGRGDALQKVRDEIGPDCRRCPLCELGRKQVVNSVGNLEAQVMFVGEAPGADEDAQGEPFVGRAGQLLTDIIEKGMGLRRSDVFIGNINRCRPPGNRAPTGDESSVCKPFLLKEIEIVKPKVIIVLGATAAHNLLETKVPIGKLRGHFQEYRGTMVMPTFHPAYLLRDPHKKREVWEDVKTVLNYLRSN